MLYADMSCFAFFVYIMSVGTTPTRTHNELIQLSDELVYQLDQGVKLDESFVFSPERFEICLRLL